MRDLRSLETVIWVVRLGGFRAAAARLICIGLIAAGIIGLKVVSD